MLRRAVTYSWTVLLLGVLAACGSNAVPAGPAPTAVQPTREPAVAAVVPTAIVAQAPAAGTAAAAPTASPGAATIPEGLTPEGYHVLGRPDAPVTLVMYSDFL